jgi:hypothetical protein
LLSPPSEVDAATRLSALIDVRITSALRLGAEILGFLKAGRSRTTVYGCKIVIVANHYDLPFRNDLIEAFRIFLLLIDLTVLVN